jgi:DNA gyrase/topoisomerase IV subunit A
MTIGDSGDGREIRIARMRLEFLEAICDAVDNREVVLRLIKEAETRTQASEKLQGRFSIPKASADAILALPWSTLTAEALRGLADEVETCRNVIAGLTNNSQR